HARDGARATREVVLRLTATHPRKEALELFAREVAPAGTSWSPGTTGAGGRPSVSPWIRQFAFLLDKAMLCPSVVIDARRIPVDVPPGRGESAAPDSPGEASEPSEPSAPIATG